ncbi:MAG: hydroxylamine reductase [Marinifilaceae bacterium]|jgi:hydroxylamine reductase|nr:hydroxylamine reductase [Marinifilaceae bacterium]
MFCFQCQEAAKGEGCTVKGVCGKTDQVASMLDLLLFTVKGISVVSTAIRKANKSIPNESESNIFVLDGLFASITNANFDEEAIVKKIDEGFKLRDELVSYAKAESIDLPNIDLINWKVNKSDYDSKSRTIGVLSEFNEDVRSLKELTIYGLKGLAAYVMHAINLGYDDIAIHIFIQEAFYKMYALELNADELTALVIETGNQGVAGMALLDKANTEKYGHPEITEVNIGTRKNPGILISGHDLKDMEELLEQTVGTGVDIYTHGEMLPANYYPAFKKYDHFVGNYGNSWWKQKEEFETFNGPILFTTNCIVPPTKNANYTDKIFTTGSSGYPGCKHIEADADGKKDFSEVIELAKKCKAPIEIEKGSIIGGFAHNQVFQLADKVVEAVKSGAIKQFVVMGGCDGRMKSRTYYTDFAEALPKDMVILTAGCAKYRYNKLNLGDINGIPRVLDAGQCNDSYSLAVIALKLKEVFELNDINDLPITYNIAWYEQKAVIVLLALLALGVKNIHIGPTLPAFLSPNVAKVLIDTFNLGTISTVEEDIVKMFE